MSDTHWTDPVKQEQDLRRNLIAESQNDSGAFAQEVLRRMRAREPMTVDMTVRASIVGIEMDSDTGMTVTIVLPGPLLPWAPESSGVRVRPESVTSWRFVD